MKRLDELTGIEYEEENLEPQFMIVNEDGYGVALKDSQAACKAHIAWFCEDGYYEIFSV